MDNFDLRKYLAEGRLLKEELTFSFDEYSYEIDDPAYKAEVEAGIKAQLPNISDEVLQAIIDSSVEYYYDQREEDVPSSDIVDMAVDYYNDEMSGDSKPSAPRQKYDLSSVDLSGLDKGQKAAFDVFVDVYLKPYGDTDTQEDIIFKEISEDDARDYIIYGSIIITNSQSDTNSSKHFFYKIEGIYTKNDSSNEPVMTNRILSNESIELASTSSDDGVYFTYTFDTSTSDDFSFTISITNNVEESLRVLTKIEIIST